MSVDPLTLGVFASLAGTALSAGTAIQQGQQAAERAKFEAAESRRQADIQEQQAERQRISTRQAVEDFERDRSRDQARRRALFGVTGVDPGAGSPLLASEEFAREAALQAGRLRAGGETQAVSGVAPKRGVHARLQIGERGIGQNAQGEGKSDQDRRQTGEHGQWTGDPSQRFLGQMAVDAGGVMVAPASLTRW